MSGITVFRLHKELGKIIADGEGRKKVSINKNTFTHNLESDGCVILPVMKAEIEWIQTIDDDGGHKENKDGSESGSTVCVLYGDEVKKKES